MHTEEAKKYLEKHHWTLGVAGEVDFNNAAKAIELMTRHNLGILISGEYGVGKTALANAIAAGMPDVLRVRMAIPWELEKLTTEWEEYNATPTYNRNILIDDLGAESTRNNYGIRYEPGGDFLVRYFETKEPSARLILTTNLTERELDARYGGRVNSRLKALCVPLRLQRPDKRSWRKA